MNFEEAITCSHQKFNELFHTLLKSGAYFPPSSYETCFLSSQHSTETVNSTLERVESASPISLVDKYWCYDEISGKSHDSTKIYVPNPSPVPLL